MELTWRISSQQRGIPLHPGILYVLPTLSSSSVCGLGKNKCRIFGFQGGAIGRSGPYFGLNSHRGRGGPLANNDILAGKVSIGMGAESRNNRQFGGSSRKKVELADIATGALDVCGWNVLLKDNGDNVGVVDEIIHIGSADSGEIFESVLKLVYTARIHDDGPTTGSDAEDEDDVDQLETLVPLVQDIVREVDVRRRRLYITPPEGLLELARIPRLLRDLERQLSDFCRQQNDGVRDCRNTANANKRRNFFDEDGQTVAQRGEVEPGRLEVFMPTRRQLIASGRHDLVEIIMAAGGFLSVAHALQLPSRRRPNGFWEDLRNLDAEIEWFVSGSWIKEDDPETGGTLYRNKATDEVSRQRPTPGSVSNPVPVSQNSFDEGTAVMPRQRKVLQAGRYDLHHAIVAHGGYRLVAQVLGRQPASKDSTSEFISKMKIFMKEQSLSHLPSLSELKAFGRNDLVYLLRRNGGLNTLADIVNIRPKRYGKGQWKQIEVAAVAIRSYICKKLIKERSLRVSLLDQSHLENKVWNDALRAGTLKVPSQSSLLKDHRADLRYLLQKFGRKELSDYLGIVDQGLQHGSSSMKNIPFRRAALPLVE